MKGMQMNKDQFLSEQFRTLRQEISATKARLFLTVALGVVAVPVLTYLAEQPDLRYMAPILPFVVLVFTMLFLSEESALMRCGRYIRERIEPLVEEGLGWEAWLETHTSLRTMDKCLFACFLLTFFVFYFASAGMAIESLWTSGDEGMSADGKAIAGSIVYAIGALWMTMTMMQHWRSLVATTPKE